MQTLAAGLLVGAALSAQAAADNPLAQERWRTRPLVVVVPAANHPLLSRLDAELQGPAMRAAFAEREMVLYKVVDGIGSRDGQAISTVQTRALLKALEVDGRGPATVLLVGLDGEVKVREGAEVSLPSLFATIDQMPMRRRR